MIALLDAKHQDICFSACGVLLNLTVDRDKRVILKDTQESNWGLLDCRRILYQLSYQGMQEYILSHTNINYCSVMYLK